LSGCATLDGYHAEQGLVAAREHVQRTYLEAARDQRASGDLAAALESLKIVDAVNPQSEGLQEQITSLQAEIDDRVSDLKTTADVEIKQGNRGQGLRSLLQALALRPGDQELRRTIAANYSVIAVLGIADNPTPFSAPTEADEVAYAMSVLAKSATDAHALFEEGLKLIDTHPANARDLFARVLELDPTHLGARAYLDVLPAR
jgi:hypothetical protein